ncbi:hypothetical protein Tco_0660664 [Tanacetum coccineum]
MAPKRATRSTPAITTTTTFVTNAQLKALIDQGVADALATRDTDRSMNVDDNHNSGTGVRRQAPPARECTYPDFMKCKPIQRISLTGFPAQSVGSSNTDVLDSPCLLVLITGTSQSRQHVITSLIHIESCKSPTKSLFDVGSSRISIFTVNT